MQFVCYLDQRNYYALDINASLIEAGKQELKNVELLHKQPHLLVDDKFALTRFSTSFDYALAQSVFTHLTINQIGRCLAEVRKVLKPEGKLFATFFEAPAPVHLALITHPRGKIETNYDTDPFHYSFFEMEWLSGLTGLSVQRIGEWGYPRDQRMLCFSVR